MSETTVVVGGDLTKLSVLEELVLSYKPALKLALVTDKGEKELKASYKKIKDTHIASKQARTQIKKAKSDLLEPTKEFTASVNAMAKNLDDQLIEVVNYLTPLRDEYEAEEKARKAKEKADKEAEEKAKAEEHAKVVAEKESELDKANKRIAELEARFKADALAKEIKKNSDDRRSNDTERDERKGAHEEVDGLPNKTVKHAPTESTVCLNPCYSGISSLSISKRSWFNQ
ncbi:MAG: hypothetical protein KAH32_09280 [Chlamydiia bacterium]|nr:hypothetical protein [Chlamydiia bacterium]